ncbi:MAG: hypothetical protein U0Q18_11870 [Bryobacteraceae bacterium]
MAEVNLKDAIEHLAFEVHQYRSFSRLVETRVVFTWEPLASQAVLTAILLHLRLLLDFFYATPRQDDVCWRHFTAVPHFQQHFPAELLDGDRPEVETFRKKLHKRLVHFTATRWTDNQQQFMNSYMRMFPLLDKALLAFETSLPPDLEKAYEHALEIWQQKQPCPVPEDHPTRIFPDPD